MKNTDYLSWDEYFMGIALLSAMRSKDPHTQVGACIVDEDNKILSVGYNGMPCGCSDDDYSGFKLKGGRIYTTLFPCNECTKALIQSGIQEVIFKEDKYSDTASVMAAKRMMRSAGITYRKYSEGEKPVRIDL